MVGCTLLTSPIETHTTMGISFLTGIVPCLIPIDGSYYHRYLFLERPRCLTNVPTINNIPANNNNAIVV